MAKIFAIILSYFLILPLQAASLEFEGMKTAPIVITPDRSTGLDNIYVLEESDGVVASFVSQSSASKIVWYKFNNLGGAYAVEIPSSQQGNLSSITLGKEDCGYIIEQATERFYFWIVNYANHPFHVSQLTVSGEDNDCSSVMLIPQGLGDRITYYTINGASKELDREIEVSYNTLKYSEDDESYRQTHIEISFPALSQLMRVDAPLCDTSFRLAGDRFLQAWGKPESVESSFYHTTAISAETSATQTERDNDNESSDSATGLGGSAPVEIQFRAEVTDAVRFTEWQFSKSSDFEEIDLRFSSTDITYVFRDYGTTYVRFMASNNDGNCDFFSQTYEVYVGESKLLCPNAFSPGVSEGVNDEWKVSYKSIVEFECHIFNRWGTKIITLTDPSQGWDGKYNGKLVPAGVYYYVIRAKGADGHNYKLSGDINIIGYKRNNISGGENPNI